MVGESRAAPDQILDCGTHLSTRKMDTISVAGEDPLEPIIE
jgi:hypothetical protein